MSPEIDQNRGRRSAYSTKTVEYVENGPGRYQIMMTRFDPARNEALSNAGYRNGVYVLYALLGGGVRDATTDTYAFDRKVSSADDDSLIKLLQAAKSANGWQRITDGKAYSQSEIESRFE